MPSGRRRGSRSARVAATPVVTTALIAKIERAPTKCAAKLARGRDSMMPSSRPETTLPTTRPRVASEARWPAKGTMTCTELDAMPIASEASRNRPALGAMTARASATTSTPSVTTMSVLFSTISPSGTMNRRPAA